jgi:AraC family transcriptional activator of pobA
MRPHIPRLEIGPLSQYKADDLMVNRLAEYLAEHPNLVFPHRHSFYHMVFFTAGGGSHTIDFNRFPVIPGQIYFMIPGQVHSWNFEGKMEGYVVNFSELFFRSFLLEADYLETFSFFDGDSNHAVVQLDEALTNQIAGLFEALLVQRSSKAFLGTDMMRVLLIQIFIQIEQSDFVDRSSHAAVHKNQIVRAFQKLISKNFAKMRSPGEYASMLNVTPNHLNALCKEYLGVQAGALIRNRTVLETKRLLINLDLTVSEIAFKLNFNDNSYFTKFFKKETGMTPEEFRKKMVNE